MTDLVWPHALVPKPALRQTNLLAQERQIARIHALKPGKERLDAEAEGFQIRPPARGFRQQPGEFMGQGHPFRLGAMPGQGQHGGSDPRGQFEDHLRIGPAESKILPEYGQSEAE